MTTYRRFAVAGAGNVGKAIVNELMNQKLAGQVDDIVILTRETKGSDKNSTATTATEAAPRVVVVDYASVPSLQSALANVDVVVSTLGYAAIFTEQINLASACEPAGVTLFVPSQYGLPGRTGIPTDSEFRAVLGSVGTTVFYTGVISDMLFNESPYAGLMLRTGSVIIPGDGRALISFTSRGDVARFVAHVLTTLPPSKLINREFRVEGERTSLQSIVNGYQERMGNSLAVNYLPVYALREAVEKNVGDVLSHIRLAWALGKGVVGERDELDNYEYSDWNPATALDVIV